jgi:hypothetical protein
MAQIQAPYTFATGDQVTAANLNAHTNSAILLPGSITDQPNITANTVAAGDSVALYDLSDLTLKEATVGDLLNSGINITTGSIAGVTGANLVITPAATFALSVAGNLSTTANFAVTGTSTLTGNVTASGTLTVTGNAAFNTSEAIKIPVGTTVQRPASPVAGQFRYNSTLDEAEFYNGTLWKAAGGGPFDATGGGITTVDGYKIHSFIVSGTFTPDTTKEGKIEYLVVAGGGGGAYYNPHGGGGGGGQVTSGIMTINKGSAPITVTIGSGGAVGSNGTNSSFGAIVANGGSAGSGYNGGASGNGNAGTNGNFNSGGGGGGGAQNASSYMYLGGGVGGEGFGSRINGGLQVYGGGGGGAGSNYAATSNYPGLGIYGGGRGAYNGANATLAAINSGGGGGGGNGRNGFAASNGADGVVIIRYRVS